MKENVSGCFFLNKVYVNTTVEHYDSFFVHKGGKLEKRQFFAKMHSDCTKLRLKFQKFSGGDTPRPHPWGGDTPPQAAPRSALSASTRTPPETNGWIKALAPPMVKSSDSSSCDYLLTRMEKNLGIPRLITWQDIAISN